jgi:hypothetical protein
MGVGVMGVGVMVVDVELPEVVELTPLLMVDPVP